MEGRLEVRGIETGSLISVDDVLPLKYGVTVVVNSSYEQNQRIQMVARFNMVSDAVAFSKRLPKHLCACVVEIEE